MDGLNEVVFGPDQHAYIRSLVAYWNIAETGAAGLCDADLEEIDDEDDNTGNLICMFLETAKLTSFKGNIKNPYKPEQHDQAELATCLDPVPDQEIAALFRSGEDIAFEAGDEDIKIWQAANMGGDGIDPKRPFGTGQVSRDIRSLVDPDRTLNNKEFAKRKKQLESRMLLFLQYFVQNAELPFATYTTNDEGGWTALDDLEEERGEWIDRCEWISRVAASHYYQTQNFAETLAAASHLLWDDRLSGAYGELVAGLKLDNHYGVNESSWSWVPTVEIVELGLKEFPETAYDTENKTLTLMLLLIYLSQSRFRDALDLLERSNVVRMKADNAFQALNPQELTTDLVFFLGADLARLGLEVVESGRYLDDPKSDISYPTVEMSWLTEINRTHECPPDEDDDLFWCVKAMVGQVMVLRGPYIPD